MDGGSSPVKPLRHVTLYPGRYRFACGCERGYLYEPFEVRRKNDRYTPYCFYCAGTGKFIKQNEMENLDFSYNRNTGNTAGDDLFAKQDVV
jgi:hypothetical protein